MMDDAGQDLSGVLLVVAHLGTSVGVVEAEDILHAFVDIAQGEALLCLHFHALDHGIHAAHGGQDPDVVPDAGLPVLPAVAAEGHVLRGRHHRDIRLIPVFQLVAQGRADVVDVDPGALRDILLGIADAEAVLDDGLPLFDILQGEFVGLGNILDQGDFLAVHAQDRALGQRMKRHRDLVFMIDLNKIQHMTAFPQGTFGSPDEN